MKRLVFLALLLSGCTHSIHLVHMGDFEPTYKAFNKGEWVSAETEQFTILGFVTQTDYVDKAYAELKSQCPKGQIQGVQTEYLTSHGFFSWTNRIRMQGLCI